MSFPGNMSVVNESTSVVDVHYVLCLVYSALCAHAENETWFEFIWADALASAGWKTKQTYVSGFFRPTLTSILIRIIKKPTRAYYTSVWFYCFSTKLLCCCWGGANDKKSLTNFMFTTLYKRITKPRTV